MLQLLRHSRPLNLLIIALIMGLMKFSIIGSALTRLSAMTGFDFQSQISSFEFVLLVLSVISMAAGGYMLNDSLDTERDEINNKAKGDLEKGETIATYLLTFGVILGLGLGYYLGNIYLGLIQTFAASTLYVYNVSLKNSPGFGNVMVAFLGGLVPLTVGLYEVPLLNSEYLVTLREFQGLSFNFIGFWIIGFSVFAFGLTLAREMIKDMEDYEGDQKTGATTLPIYFGITSTKATVTLVYGAIIYGLWHVYSNYLPDQFTYFYSILLMALVLVSVVLTWIANDSKKHKLNSNFNKVISLIGLGYAIAFQIMMTQGTFIL